MCSPTFIPTSQFACMAPQLWRQSCGDLDTYIEEAVGWMFGDWFVFVWVGYDGNNEFFGIFGRVLELMVKKREKKKKKSWHWELLLWPDVV